MPDQPSTIQALIARARTLTGGELTALADAWDARDIAGDAARDAVRAVAWAAGTAARAARAVAWATGVAVGDAAWDATCAAARDTAWAAGDARASRAAWAATMAAGDAARAAALALALRDQLPQDAYDVLTGPWARVIGRVHPADPDRRGSDA
jgi:hypothetical protein